MTCPGCGRNGVVHPYGRDPDAPCSKWPKCPTCGVGAEPPETFIAGSEQVPIMREFGCCFSCACFENMARIGCKTVIDGCIYTPGTRTEGSFRGMAGRRFDIEYFDGRKVTTFDLWSGGQVPAAFRERIPDTARFAGGAERCVVGETICWNPSKEPKP